MEVWRILKNFKKVESCMYEISNYGFVRNFKTKEILHMKIANKKYHPYYAVYLQLKTGKKEWVLVHQLVAHCFLKLPDLDQEYVPDHIDNNGLNNHVENLRYLTRSENIKDAFRKGYIDNSCDKNSNALINNDDARNICDLLSKGKTYDEIISILNLDNTDQIRKLLVRIKNRNAWLSISNEFIFPNDYMYTNKQNETVVHLHEIRNMISDGKSTRYIVNKIWGENHPHHESKMCTVRNIKNGKIYSNIV